MTRRANVWIVLILFVALVGCAMSQPAGVSVYHDDFLTVSLEPNPAWDGQVRVEVGARKITTPQLADVLRGVEARKITGIIGPAVGLSEFEPVFSADDLWLVATEIRSGLRQASSQERVAFQLRKQRGKGREETRGSMYLRGRVLHVTLSKYRVSNRLDYEGAEGGNGKAIELRYEPSDALVQKPQNFNSRWLEAEAAEVFIDVQMVAGSTMPRASGFQSEQRPEPVSAAEPMPPPSPVAAPPPVMVPPKTETAKPSPAPSAVTMEVLQQQIKELSEETARLRQELAETKQLLADKVLELNRLKEKAPSTPR